MELIVAFLAGLAVGMVALEIYYRSRLETAEVIQARIETRLLIMADLAAGDITADEATRRNDMLNEVER